MSIQTQENNEVHEGTNLPKKYFACLHGSCESGKPFYCDTEYYNRIKIKTGLTDDQLKSIGIERGKMFINKGMLYPLKKISECLLKKKYRMIIKSAWLPSALGDLIKENPDHIFEDEKIFDWEEKSHATGLVIEIAISHSNDHKMHHVPMWNPADDRKAMLRSFYRYRSIEEGHGFHLIQMSLDEIFIKEFGFRPGYGNVVGKYQLPLLPATKRY